MSTLWAIPSPRAEEPGRRFFCRSNTKTSTASLHIYDAVGPYYDGVSSKAVAKALDEVRDAKTLNVFINSPGGDVFEGVAIYNQLLRFSGDVNVHVDGLAASIASVIAMAGKTISMAANAQMMIHDPWTVAIGDAREMRAAAEMLDKTRGTLIETYAKRTRGDAKKIDQWMADETWMTAAEAKARGFADAITDEDEASKSEARAFTMLEKFKNTPAELREKARAMSTRIDEAEAYMIRLRTGTSPAANAQRPAGAQRPKV